MMDMSMGMELLPQQQMRASPALIQLNSMLVLSSMDLQQLVQQELEENPALEQSETSDTFCPNCGRPLNGVTCLVCLQEDDRLRQADRDDVSAAPSDDEFDPLLAVAAPITLGENLQRDLRVSLPEADRPLIDYLVGSLNTQGYLEASVDEVANALNLSTGHVEAVLKKLQELGPAGVGARDVQECLLIQLTRLERNGTSHPYVAQIVREHWLDLAEHRYGEIARVLGIGYQDVVEARDFIRQHLRPYPLEQSEDAQHSPAVLPDVLINEENGILLVEVVESRNYMLRLNPLYQRLAQAIASGQQEASSEDRAHMQEYVTRARQFLTNLRQRRETIRRISVYIVERQEAYLRNGVRHLTPLTRAEVAAALGVHESTVSRATANKYCQLPSREIIPFSTFFHASLSVKDVIQELVSREEQPLTDEQIVLLLRERGYDLARRTVAKYRTQLGILPSQLR